MNKKIYDVFELTILEIKEDVIRTSEIFTSEELSAPDVYEQDPFVKG